MEQISIYFKKFEGFGAPGATTKKILISAIVEALGEGVRDELASQKIKIEEDKIRIGVVGPIKSEILLNKNKIQALFEKKLAEANQKTDKKII